jgi:hypothetical protein
MEGIVHPLIMPPLIGMINFAYVGMVRSSEKINLSQVICISEMIDDTSVESRSAVRNIGVTVNISPIKPVGLAIHSPLMTIIGRAFRSLVRMREIIRLGG